jgi:ABC-type transport system involved in multi-copper enzyme maturation permease subunit
MRVIGRQLMPLLGKELTELAARRRTYVMRTCYALLLYLFFFLIFNKLFTLYAGDPMRLMGSGREVFDFLIVMQFVGIYVFLPATMAGVITYEKERESLSLLLLTGMRPWGILTQKFLGRLLPMFTFLLLSLPILALAYSYGGISMDALAGGVYILLVTGVQVGAWALMCSCFFRTTVQAFIWCYVLGTAFYLGPALIAVFFELLLDSRVGDEDVFFAFLPPYIYADTMRSGFAKLVARSVPCVFSAVVFFAMARVFLLRRAFVRGRSALLRVFQGLDRFWGRWNRLFGGIVLLREPDTLPTDRPIVWREVTKKSLGRTTYLLRVFLLIEVPVLLTAGPIAAYAHPGWQAEALSLIVGLLWGLAALVLVVRGANSIVSERTNQTLDVLLTTPITSRDIVKQKVRGARRVSVVLAIPIATVVLLEAWAEGGGWAAGRYDYSVPAYLAFALIPLVVLFPMLTWLSTLFGLRMRTRGRATIMAVVLVTVWVVLPFLILFLLDEAFDLINVDDPPWSFLFLLSPGALILFPEDWSAIDYLLEDHVWTAFGLAYAWYGMLCFAFRWICLWKADKYLGRAAPGRRLARRAPPAPRQEGG